MADPRIRELLEHMGKVGPDGQPTRLAQFAQKVEEYMVEIEGLRAGLEQSATEISEMEQRVASTETHVKERESVRMDLAYEVQDVAVRSAMAGTSAGAAGLLRQVEEKRAQLADFDKVHGGEKTRLERMKISLSTRRAVIRKDRDLIALRLNTIEALLRRVDQESGLRMQGRAVPTATAVQAARANGVRQPSAGPRRRARRIIIRRR